MRTQHYPKAVVEIVHRAIRKDLEWKDFTPLAMLARTADDDQVEPESDSDVSVCRPSVLESGDEASKPAPVATLHYASACAAASADNPSRGVISSSAGTEASHPLLAVAYYLGSSASSTSRGAQPAAQQGYVTLRVTAAFNKSMTLEEKQKVRYTLFEIAEKRWSDITRDITIVITTLRMLSHMLHEQGSRVSTHVAINYAIQLFMIFTHPDAVQRETNCETTDPLYGRTPQAFATLSQALDNWLKQLPPPAQRRSVSDHYEDAAVEKLEFIDAFRLAAQSMALSNQWEDCVICPTRRFAFTSLHIPQPFTDNPPRGGLFVGEG